MSNSLGLVVSTIQRLLQRAWPATSEIIPGNGSDLLLVIYSQLQRTQKLLDDLPEEAGLDWHGLMYDELYRVVTRILSTLDEYLGDISTWAGDTPIPEEARGEHVLENLLDLRWWTWMIALQAGMLLKNSSSYDIYCEAFKGVLEAKFSGLPLSGLSVTRRLPSYSFELWLQGRLTEILQPKIEGNRMLHLRENEGDMLLIEMRNVELPCFEIKQLGLRKLQDAGKPGSIQDYLEIDLTQDLLGASSTGYVIRTTFSDRQGGSYSCAMKRINTMDDKPPDLARLCHPHVVRLIHHWSENCGLRDGVCGWIPKPTFMTFLVMELMDCDLAKLFTRTKKAGVGPFSLRVAVDIMLQIAKGMLYLHDMGVSHPHLKCDNVLCRAENETEAYRVGDVLIKLGGFGCPITANVDTKNRDVFCFGLTCLEILTGDKRSEDVFGNDRAPRSRIPETTPPILKHGIASCLDMELTFSEVVIMLLLSQCQIMQTRKDRMMLSSKTLHIKKTQTKNQDSASSSRSQDGLQEMFHVHQLHPQLGEVAASIQTTLVFFHGFPKVLEEWKMTWMTRDNKLLWPQKWLPEDLNGDVRVLSVSFDDRPNVSSNGIQFEISKNLLQRLVLSATWKLGEIEQAIVLVGHGFGGVIIKTLVNEAQRFIARKTINSSMGFQEVMKCKKFLKKLASFVFYSVPHALTSTEFENYISGCSNTRVLQRSSLLKSLRGDPFFIPEMIRISMDFESAAPIRTKALVFLEGNPMNKKYFLVSENSCERLSPSWEWHKVDKDNHFEVCRPDSKSHTCYKILLRHLQQYMSTPSDISSLHVNNVRRQSWKVIGTVFVVICKFKKLLGRRSKVICSFIPVLSKNSGFVRGASILIRILNPSE